MIAATRGNCALNHVGLSVPDLGAAETEEAIAAAHRAFPGWAAKAAKERAQIMRAWFDLMIALAGFLGFKMFQRRSRS